MEGVDEPDDVILVRPVSNLVTDMDDYSLNHPKLDDVLQKQRLDSSESGDKIKSVVCLSSGTFSNALNASIVVRLILKLAISN